MKSGSRKFRRMVDQEREVVRRVNRPSWEGEPRRFVKKVMIKENWFKSKK